MMTTFESCCDVQTPEYGTSRTTVVGARDNWMKNCESADGWPAILLLAGYLIILIENVVRAARNHRAG